MGFCERCGDIVTSGKCKRYGCYGKGVASITGSMSADGNAADKWQSQYQTSILAAAEINSNASASRRSSLSRTPIASPTTSAALGRTPIASPTTSTAPTTVRRVCAECNKRLFCDTPTFIDPEDHDKLYCQNCHLKKFSMGNCRNCFKPVFPRERPWVKYNSRYWHKNCFVCRHCQSDLGDEPLVDLGGLPCCEPCLEEHAGQRPEDIPTVHEVSETSIPPTMHSPIQRMASPYSDRFESLSTYSSPRLPPSMESPVFWSDRSPAVGAQISRPDSPQESINLPARSASPFSDYSETSSRPSSPNSMYSFASSKISSTISDDVMSTSSADHYFKPHKPTTSISHRTRERTISLPSSPAARPSLHVHSHDEDDDHSQYETDIEIPVPTSRLGRKMSTPFLNSVHPHCARCHEGINSTSVQLPTGETFHQSCFTCTKCNLEFTESQFIINAGRVYHPKCAPTTQIETMSIKCAKCCYPIDGQFIRNDGASYHLKCFNCAGCSRIISPHTPFSQINHRPYCDSCRSSQLSDPRSDRRASPPLARSSPVLGATVVLPITDASSSEAAPSDVDRVKPSAIFTTRTKPLPKLGGSKVCPRCQKTVGFIEEISGPRATKWHKKCLGCVGCKKQLDSAAIIDEENGVWMPYCRNCHDKRRMPSSPRFTAVMTSTRTALVS